MRTGKRVLVLGLVALLSACSQPAGVRPPAPGVSGVDAPRFAVLAASDYTAFEDAVLAGINQERASNGLPALSEWNVLRRLAREHSQDMVDRRYFNHTTPDGLTPYHRVKAANIAFTAIGETSHYPDVRPQSAVADWLRHPGGKVQMLSDRFTTAGVGIAYSNELHRYYVNVIYIRQPAEGSTYTPTQPIAPLD